MFESFTAYFGSFLLSPWLFALGALAVLSPIIIHLLNRRTLKVVDWAAMDFLLEAQRRNRYRVQLENLLLLALRCLAMIFIGLMLARPFNCAKFAPNLAEADRFERIVLLDDSLSMEVVAGNQTIMENAKDELKKFVEELSKNESDDSLTLLLASDPKKRVLNGAPVDADSLDMLLKTIDELESTDQVAQLEEGLTELRTIVREEAKNVSRVVYLASDLRRRDWKPDQEESENHPTRVLSEISEESSACFLIDLGRPDEPTGNLAITSISAENTLVADVSAEFQVTVANMGEETVRDARVEFTVGGAAPLERVVDEIAAGDTANVVFTFKFKLPPLAEGENPMKPTPIKVQAEVIASEPDQDRLTADSVHYYAAQVVRGVPALIVDGAPSSVARRAESTFLRRALRPPGDALTGVTVDVVTDTELERVRLEQYQVLFLCNVYKLGSERVAVIAEWVKNGGGLVIMPGDQIDDLEFNAEFCQGEHPLAPLSLEIFAGDESQEEWIGFRVKSETHAALQEFAGEENPLLSPIKVFRWWKTNLTGAEAETLATTTISTDADGDEKTESKSGKETKGKAEGDPDREIPLSGEPYVLARFTNEESDIAIAERRYGDGRVMMFAIPGDRDWTDWPDDPSFLVAMQEITGYIAANESNKGALLVSEPIRLPLDLRIHKQNARVLKPDGGKANAQASDDVESSEDAGPIATTQQTIWQIDYEETEKRGFYEMSLERNKGGEDALLYAANSDPSEGDLKRVGLAKLDESLTGTKLSLVSFEEAANQSVEGAQREWWKTIFYFLVGVLFLELTLGWLFGRGR